MRRVLLKDVPRPPHLDFRDQHDEARRFGAGVTFQRLLRAQPGPPMVVSLLPSSNDWGTPTPARESSARGSRWQESIEYIME